MSDNTEALPPLPEPTVYTHALEVNWALKNVGRAGSFYATPENPNDLKLFTADQMRDYARAALAQRQQVPAEPTLDRESTWWALAMGAAASLEDAANCMRDPDAEKAARGAAAHVRRQCTALTAAPSAQAEPLRAHLSRARAMMQAFCDRVDAGQVRSVKTYSAFKAFLEETRDV
ncbi:MAG: hypothetical protein AB7U98_13730 [Candidatus Nitrosocosmicus sp.]